MKLKRNKKPAPKPEPENTYIAPLHLDDAKRKEWFTIYDVNLVNKRREIELNHNPI